jgi:hypothetical protein
MEKVVNFNIIISFNPTLVLVTKVDLVSIGTELQQTYPNSMLLQPPCK